MVLSASKTDSLETLEQTAVKEICIKAIKQIYWTLEYVKEQTPELCMAVVQQNGAALEYVKEQTPEICMAAVQENDRALKYVKEQNPEICIAALKKQNFTRQIILSRRPFEFCIKAIKRDGVVKQNGNTLEQTLFQGKCLVCKCQYTCEFDKSRPNYPYPPVSYFCKKCDELPRPSTPAGLDANVFRYGHPSFRHPQTSL